MTCVVSSSPALSMSPADAASEASIASALVKRASGSLRSAWRIASSRRSGTPSTSVDGGATAAGRLGGADLLRRLAGIRRAAGERVVENGTEAEEVARRRERLAVQLFGRHEAQGADARVVVVPVVRPRRDPEVDELGGPRAEHDVRRRHVAVNEAPIVDHPQAAEQLAADAEHLVGRERAFGSEPVTQGAVAVEQLHHDVMR